MALPDPEAVERLARLHKKAASVLGEASSNAVRALEGASFDAPVADAVTHNASRHQATLRHQADQLLDVSLALSKHAEWIRDTIADLKSLEVRIRAWADANPPGTSIGMADASMITWWPDAASVEWYDLADRLRTRGAVF